MSKIEDYLIQLPPFSVTASILNVEADYVAETSVVIRTFTYLITRQKLG